MSDKVSMVIQNLSMTIAGLTFGFLYSWKLALVALSVAPLIIISTGLVMVVSKIVVCQGKAGYTLIQLNSLSKSSFSWASQQ